MPVERITSPQNPFIKKIVRLRDAKERRKEQLTIVEGVREIRMAVRNHVPIKRVYFCRELLLPSDIKELIDPMVSSASAEVFETDAKIFEKIAFGNRNEGVLAVCQPQVKTLKDLKLSAKSLCVILEGVEKPGNLGAILRTCDAAKVDALFICDLKTDIYNPNVVRASLGAVFSVPIIVCDGKEALDFFKKNNARIYATSPQAKKNYTEADLKGSSVIALGSEEEGLSPFWLKSADEQVRIPLAGQVNSLNVSAATAVLVYEALRQRDPGKR